MWLSELNQNAITQDISTLKLISKQELITLAIETSQTPAWLFDESLKISGNQLEAATLLIRQSDYSARQDAEWWFDYIKQLIDLPQAEKFSRIIQAWQELNDADRFMFNKVITGGLKYNLVKEQSQIKLAQAQKLHAVLAYTNLDRTDGLVELNLGVDHDGNIVMICQLELSLPAETLDKLKQFVFENQIGKYGPKLALAPKLICEISYQTVIANKRAKAGVNLTTVEILNWNFPPHSKSVSKLNEVIKG